MSAMPPTFSRRLIAVERGFQPRFYAALKGPRYVVKRYVVKRDSTEIASKCDDSARICLDNQPDSYTWFEVEGRAGARRQVHDEAFAGVDVRDHRGAFAPHQEQRARQNISSAEPVRLLVRQEDVACPDRQTD